MVERFRLQAVRAVVGSLAVIAAGCGSKAGLSVTGPTSEFAAGVIEIAPAGANVGTAVTLQSRRALDPTGGPLSYSWDFGDGSTGWGEATTHVYATGGTFMATVTVISIEGGSTRATLNLPVSSLTGRWTRDDG